MNLIKLSALAVLIDLVTCSSELNSSLRRRNTSSRRSNGHMNDSHEEKEVVGLLERRRNHRDLIQEEKDAKISGDDAIEAQEIHDNFPSNLARVYEPVTIDDNTPRSRRFSVINSVASSFSAAANSISLFFARAGSSERPPRAARPVRRGNVKSKKSAQPSRSAISRGSGNVLSGAPSSASQMIQFMPSSNSNSKKEVVDFDDLDLNSSEKEAEGEIIKELLSKMVPVAKNNNENIAVITEENEDAASVDSKFSYEDADGVIKNNSNRADSDSEEDGLDEFEYSSQFDYEVRPATEDPFEVGNTQVSEATETNEIEGALTESLLDSLRDEFIKNKAKMVKSNALAYLNVYGALLKREGTRRGKHFVSHPLSRIFKPANQKSSFNCAVYPVLGAMRYHLARKIDLKNDFQFNPGHLNYFDLMEKSNAFLEIFLRNVHLPLESFELTSQLEKGISQSSDWQSIMRLIEKYGITPKFPNVKRVNNRDPHAAIRTLTSTLRSHSKRIHDYFHANPNDPDRNVKLAKLKQAAMKTAFQILSTCFGVQMHEFEWNVTTRDGKAINKKITGGPKAFYEYIIGREFGDQVTLCNYPQLEMNCHYGIKVDYRMIDNPYRKFINLPVEKLTQYALEIVLSDRPLPVTALPEAIDYESNGVLDEDRFDYKSVFRLKNYFMSKENIFATRNYNALHAFLIVGVNLDAENRPTHWLVESSWGTSKRNGKHLLMTQAWFEKYVFEIIVPRDSLHGKVASLAKTASQDFDNESDMI